MTATNTYKAIYLDPAFSDALIAHETNFASTGLLS
jgi:hypothetical protein